jgi:hypothetical protein
MSQNHPWSPPRSLIEAGPAPDRRGWVWPLLVAGVLVCFDGLILGVPMLSLLAGLYAVLALIVGLIRRRSVRTPIVLMFTFVVALGIGRFNRWLAHERAEEVIAAVEAFHAETGAYPAELEELVPKYFDEVPVAKYAISYNEFRYNGAVDSVRGPSLLYIDVAPFGMMRYYFDDKKWIYLD